MDRSLDDDDSTEIMDALWSRVLDEGPARSEYEPIVRSLKRKLERLIKHIYVGFVVGYPNQPTPELELAPRWETTCVQLQEIETPFRQITM